MMKLLRIAAALLAMLVTPAMAVDYLVHDQDGHGTTKCEFALAAEVDIAGFDYSAGDRTFMCLAPIPTERHSGTRGWSAAPAKEAPPAAETPKPDPVVPDPADPDPKPDPGECQRVSDCPIEPDPKPDPEPEPCQNKADCVTPDPTPEPDPDPADPQPEPGDCGNNGRPCNPSNPGNGNGNGNPPCPPKNKHCQ